jgi:hypothetical protein
MPSLWRQRSHLELAIDGMGPQVGAARPLTKRLAYARNGLDIAEDRNRRTAQHGLQPTAAGVMMSRRG